LIALHHTIENPALPSDREIVMLLSEEDSSSSNYYMNIFRHFTSNGQQGAVRSSMSPDSAHGGGSGSVEKTEMKNTQEDEEKQISAAEDVELVRKAQTGDTRAFDQLVSKHRGKIYAMILNMVKNDADAWDLSQEAFIKAWKALPKFESRARFSTWLFRISHNVVYDWLRKRRIQGDGELNDEVFNADRIDPGAATSPHQHARPDEAMQLSELHQQLNTAIARLSPDHREVILLREVQGLDYKEIADVTGSSMGTIMSRLHYARKKLQTYLTPQ
jgi:RNA polymerase sigma-70 factor (ECF subfamily)